MSGQDRRETRLRHLLDGPRAQVPTDLAVRAAERGRRLLRRRRALRAAGWALLLAAAVAFGVWAATAEPWSARPAWQAPPPRDG
ncbi:hypothetical protein [Streptomyces griseocarneus]|uniref:hypothetical protein n=1 Tax=Streptomyces griseocarneus TaxID=51201 RepID=UPI00167C79BF|nr:hypothetical protein [Streptomyces griseocarneus]MBZ6476605.1 hypothetical protein [Streptomyces griseocarneus]GHG79473.1 hypothetical protein GCM10018779_60220 [Streptomyces griseocarneus]